jgi:hypothetical protein
MATQRITFGEWLPDQPGVSGALTEAKNVVSQALGYGPLPLPVSLATGIGENLYTLHNAKTSGNQTYLFAGGRTGVYRVNSIGTFTNVSGTTYSTPSDSRIRFTQFGSRALFVNNADKVQAYNIETDTAFSDVAAGAPVAKYITVVRDFVVVANTLESGTRYGTRVRWSGINDETEWTYSQTTQADYQDIPDGGNIVGIRGGEFGLILMDSAIYRMSYVGTPFIFQFDNISRGTGCYEENSIAQYQGITFFLSDDGFYMCDGQTVKPIGSEKVDRWFFDNLDIANLSSMSAAVDPIRKLVVWNFPVGGSNRKLLIYNFKTSKWTNADAVVDYVSDASTGAVTLEELDSISTNIDALNQSLDSYFFVGGQHFLGGVKEDDIYSFTGLPRSGELITGDIEVGQSVVTLARPLVDGGSATVSVASRARLDQGLTYSTPVAASDENRVALRSAGKYHRLKINPTGDNWQNAVAVDVDIAPQGGR